MALKRKKAPKKPRNPAAQEATLINIRALKRRVSTLEASRKSDVDRLDSQEKTLVSVMKAINQIRDDIGKLASMGARVVTLEADSKVLLEYGTRLNAVEQLARETRSLVTTEPEPK